MMGAMPPTITFFVENRVGIFQFTFYTFKRFQTQKYAQTPLHAQLSCPPRTGWRAVSPSLQHLPHCIPNFRVIPHCHLHHPLLHLPLKFPYFVRAFLERHEVHGDKRARLIIRHFRKASKSLQLWRQRLGCGRAGRGCRGLHYGTELRDGYEGRECDFAREDQLLEGQEGAEKWDGEERRARDEVGFEEDETGEGEEAPLNCRQQAKLEIASPRAQGGGEW